MFDTILGLPVHALVVHFVVVLVPLAALGVIGMAVVPSWRERFGLVVLAVATVALVSVPVATISGKKLMSRINAQGITADQIDRHMKMGKLVIYPTAALWVLAVAMYWMNRRNRGGNAVKVVAILSIVAAVAAAVQVTITGHLGSTAVWSCTLQTSACK
jgi:uncharacterized membrane protein